MACPLTGWACQMVLQEERGPLGRAGLSQPDRQHWGSCRERSLLRALTGGQGSCPSRPVPRGLPGGGGVCWALGQPSGGLVCEAGVLASCRVQPSEASKGQLGA